MTNPTTPKGEGEREAERSAIVAWLRELVRNRERVDHSSAAYFVDFAATQIEAGAHLNQKGQG